MPFSRDSSSTAEASGPLRAWEYHAGADAREHSYTNAALAFETIRVGEILTSDGAQGNPRKGVLNKTVAERGKPTPGIPGVTLAKAKADQFGGIEAELAQPPRPARPRDLGAVLLAGPERLFLNVSPITSSA